MAQQAASVLISTALAKAGNTSLATSGLLWLNDFLRSQYRAWPWPFLHKSTAGVTLTTGTTRKTVGNSNGGVTPKIQRILDPIYVYTADKLTRAEARIRASVGGSVDMDEDVLDSSLVRGLPEFFKVETRQSSNHALEWDLVPYPFPDKDYLLKLKYIYLPDDLVLSSQNPLYPNDETLIQAIFCEALRYLKHYDELATEDDRLSAMKAADRAKFGEVFGTNDQIGLDPNTFR